MNNISIKHFHQELMRVINNCGLPVGTAYFIVKDILNELEKTYLECAYRESQNNNNISETQTINLTDGLNKEEKENEQSSENASEYSGSADNN